MYIIILVILIIITHLTFLQTNLKTNVNVYNGNIISSINNYLMYLTSESKNLSYEIVNNNNINI